MEVNITSQLHHRLYAHLENLDALRKDVLWRKDQPMNASDRVILEWGQLERLFAIQGSILQSLMEEEDRKARKAYDQIFGAM